MALLPLDKRFSPDFAIPGKKPVGPTELDLTNRYYRGRAFYLPLTDGRTKELPTSWQELSSGVLGAPTWPQPDLVQVGTPFPIYRAGWLALNQSASDGSYNSSAGIDSIALNATDGQTWIIKVKNAEFVSQGSSINTIFGIGNVTNVAIALNASNQLSVWVDNVNQVHTGIILSDDQEHTIAVVITDTLAKVYVNGVYLGSDISHSGFGGGSFDRITVGGSQASTARDSKCEVEWAGVWNYPFSAGSVVDISKNPWQQLKPKTQPVYFTASAAGGTVVNLTGQSSTSSQGTLTVTGAASVTINGQVATSAQGVLSVSTAASVDVTLTGQVITSAQGTLTVIAGAGANVLLNGQVVTSAQGSLSVSGQAALTLTGQSITSGQGTLTAGAQTVVQITGQSITSAQGAIGIISANVITLSGLESLAGQGVITIPGGVWTNQPDATTVWTEQTNSTTTWTIQ